MELRDDQVVRYSRQLLLREVGGAGQRALLSAAVSTRGRGPALEVAVAYLAASGVAVHAAPGAGGFGALNPDAQQPEGRHVTVLLGTPPAPQASWQGPAVWMGAVGDTLRLLLLSAEGCGACAARELERLGPVPPGPLSVLSGAHAALAVQRLLLGWLGSAPALIEVGASGETRPSALERCEDHRP